MKYIDLTLPTPAENLAADETLLDLCEAGGADEMLRFWEPTGLFVVLGYANRAAVEADLAECRRQKIGVFRRCSGGGTVLQGPGCLNYSVLLRIPESGPLSTITGANQFILERQRAALQPLVSASMQIQGQTDLVLGNLKFSGNAQRRRRSFLNLHGTFLLNFDLEQIERFLRMPSQPPDYRAGRSHRDFLTNLNLDARMVKEALRNAWGAHEQSPTPPHESIAEFVRTKYATEGWNFKF